MLVLLVCLLGRESLFILIVLYYFLHDHDAQAAALTHRKEFWIFVSCLIILSWFGAHDDDDHEQRAAWRTEEVA